MQPFKAVLFDIDGTLVDSNDAHASAWVKALTEFGAAVDPAHVRRCIGMGGDKLMPEVSGIEQDSPRGQEIATRRGEIFTAEFIPKLQRFRGATELVAALKERGITAVAASSASKEDLTALLEIAGVDDLMNDRTSSDDAENSKPAPDIIHAALDRAKASPSEAIMIGDTPYDIEAARRAGVETIAFRSGGWTDGDLQGAVEIYDGPWDLLERLNDSVLDPNGRSRESDDRPHSSSPGPSA
ncbi:MAG TPA: HAD family hydrolase [Vicinamibacterales bacterium]|nr:HAD family hydrolase [Vicinamibacterales bacterium]